MTDPTDSFERLQSAIERLDPDARQRLKHWLYLQPWDEDEPSEYRVAESAPRYESHYVSVEEYLEREAVSPIRHEYVDGEIFAMSGARLRHSIICANVYRALDAHLRGGPCRAFIESFKVALRTRARSFLYYPDVMVACGKVDLEAVYLNEPKLVIEVLSPSTARVDRNEKALNYPLIPALEELVLVAPHDCQVQVQRRRDDWKPTILSLDDQMLRLESVSLSLRLAEIYDGAR